MIVELKKINWLYKDVNDDCIDEVTKEVVEEVNKATSTMLEKAIKEDVAGFQCYTIRNMDNQQSVDPDIEQYKLLRVKEDPPGQPSEALGRHVLPGSLSKWQVWQVSHSKGEALMQSLKRLDCTTRTVDSGSTPSTSSISCTRRKLRSWRLGCTILYRSLGPGQ